MGRFSRISNAYGKMVDPNTVKSKFFNGEYPSRVMVNDLKFDLVYNGESPTYRATSKDSCSALFIRLTKVDTFTYSVWCQMVIQYGPNIHMDPIEVNVEAKDVEKQKDPFNWITHVVLMKEAKPVFQDFLKQIEEWNKNPAMHGRLVKAGELGIEMINMFLK